jgi:Astacin (Peptidase family M12A)
MHYGKNDFAMDPDVWTIRPKKQYAGRKIGQRDELSVTDIRKINLMYKCGVGLVQLNTLEEEEEESG